VVRTLVADWRATPRRRIAALRSALAQLRDLASGRRILATFRLTDSLPAIVAAHDFARRAIGVLGRVFARRRETRRAIL